MTEQFHKLLQQRGTNGAHRDFASLAVIVCEENGLSHLAKDQTCFPLIYIPYRDFRNCQQAGRRQVPWEVISWGHGAGTTPLQDVTTRFSAALFCCTDRCRAALDTPQTQQCHGPSSSNHTVRGGGADRQTDRQTTPGQEAPVPPWSITRGVITALGPAQQ